VERAVTTQGIDLGVAGLGSGLLRQL
jgi:hypothetical protein